MAITTPGRLPCKLLVHAVGPTWQGGQSGETTLLKMCVTNILFKTEAEKCTNVAIPALSTGVFGFPVDKSTECIVHTVKSYFTSYPKSSITEVHLIDNRMEAAELFAKNLQTVFGQAGLKGAQCSPCMYKYYFKIIHVCFKI